MVKRQFEYITYIAATPVKVWNALTEPEFTRQYWQHDNVSDWKPGSVWEHRRVTKARTVDIVGKVVERLPPRRLVITWAFPADAARKNKHSKVTIRIEPYRSLTRLTVTHSGLEAGSDMLEGITDGWPKVIGLLDRICG